MSHSDSKKSNLPDSNQASELLTGELASAYNKIQSLTSLLRNYQVAIDAHASLSITDSEGRITFVNDRFCEVTQYSREELMGKTHHIINSGFHDKSYFQSMWQQIKSGNVWRGETRNQAKDGSFFWVETTIVPDGKDPIKQFIAVRTNITKIKLVDDMLEASHKLLRSTFEMAPIGMALIKLDGRLTQVNNTLSEITGFTLDELTDKLVQEVIFQYDLAAFDRGLSDALTHPTKVSLNIRIQHKNGTVRWGMWNIVPIRNSSEELLYFIAQVHDVTQLIEEQEQKDKEQQQHQQQQQKMEAVGVLAAGIAHDFNNILGIISGYAELCLYTVEENSRTSTNLSQIISATERGREMIKQLMVFSRKDEKERQPLNIVNVLNDSLSLVRSMEMCTKVDFQVHIGDLPADLKVVTTSTEIHQVVMNLCTNACLAMQNMKNGKLDITLDIVKSTDPGLLDSLFLRVTDNGCGMEPDIVGRIFEPFFTTRDVGEGTGLGLSVVYGIIKEIGGSISVESQLGEGSSFTIWLPICA